MRVFKIPFDIKREEKIFRRIFKFKASCLFDARCIKYTLTCYTTSNSIKNNFYYANCKFLFIVYLPKNR